MKNCKEFLFLSFLSLFVTFGTSDKLSLINYRSLVNSRITVDGVGYNVISTNYDCLSSNYTSKVVYYGDPTVRCSCFGNCTIPEDCYVLQTKLIGSGKLTLGTGLDNVFKLPYYSSKLEKLPLFQHVLEYDLPSGYKTYCFDDREFGAVISDDTFKFVFSSQKYRFEYINEHVLVNYISRDYLFHSIRDQFVPDLPMKLLFDFVFSCHNFTTKANSFPAHECNIPIMSSMGKYRCSGYVGNNRCPYDYSVNVGSTIRSSFLLPFIEYDGETVGPNYLSNKFIPKYMAGLKGIFPDVLGWLTDGMDKLIRALGNLFLDSFSYIVNRIIKEITYMLPVVERFVELVVKLLRFLLDSLVKVVVVIEKQIFLSEYTVLYVVLAYYMNLEIAPLPLLVLVMLVLGVTRWFPSLLLYFLNGEFRTELIRT